MAQGLNLRLALAGKFLPLGLGEPVENSTGEQMSERFRKFRREHRSPRTISVEEQGTLISLAKGYSTEGAGGANLTGNSVMLKEKPCLSLST